ncbi:prostaglandin reductase-3 [Aplysia californica]|uniref:Prostaglandin reductase-3 n=1 Tax=Aplysia californica TaxID=6500 RepID=A0ABM0K636_APLCA|nr:prostaglandin reductase-3 [Aplysia californica]XP_005109605.1 prostaglandin reductase-3 [Aplysia californica]XP_035828564.1 prostaglandin reductase-3 [Aplysia californica]
MAAKQLPSTLRQLLVKKLGTNFREVTEIAAKPIPQLGAKDILIKNRYVGINASDINFTAGRYDPTLRPPFPAGFEGLGEVAAVGESSKIKPGQFVAYSHFGAFADYIVVPEKVAIPVPACDPGLISIMVSGLTASIALDKSADLKSGETVLVTAAAGGTGQYAVQLAKLAGCHVIGTCSSQDKVEFLQSIGCDRAVNYRQENLDAVLSKEYPKGVDVVYESVGADMFKTSVKNLARFGRLLVIGQIATYEGTVKVDDLSAAATAMMLLTKSASMKGFLLFHYPADFAGHVAKLAQLYMEGKLKVSVDKGERAATGPFVGLEKVADAVEYMYTRANVGKIVVEVSPELKSSL